MGEYSAVLDEVSHLATGWLKVACPLIKEKCHGQMLAR